MNRRRIKRITALLIGAAWIIGPGLSPRANILTPADRIVLEDFSQYPDGWKARGDLSKALEIYQPVRNESGNYLHAREGTVSIRIFKKIAWNSDAYPVVQWKWRVTKWPEKGRGQAYLYVSLDKDVFGIPTIIKYVWSRDRIEGTVTEGGFFQPAEVVVRSGPADSSEWTAERVDARADFRKIIGREPKGDAYGIGLMIDPGMEVEIAEIVASNGLSPTGEPNP